MGPYGKLGNVSWSPTVVSWTPFVSPEHQQHIGTSICDEAHSAVVVHVVETFEMDTGMLSSPCVCLDVLTQLDEASKTCQGY